MSQMKNHNGDENPGTRSALTRLLDQWIQAYAAAHGTLPVQPHDANWQSPCQTTAPDSDGNIHWRPVERQDPADFSGLERALEQPVHPDIKAYYGSFWSECIPATTTEGELTLIQIWNAEDFDRLIENIIGHAFAKSRIKAPLTLFFAHTDDDELILSVDNASGEVVLEHPGERPLRTVADTLAEFLTRLDPVVPKLES